MRHTEPYSNQVVEQMLKIPRQNTILNWKNTNITFKYSTRETKLVPIGMHQHYPPVILL